MRSRTIMMTAMTIMMIIQYKASQMTSNNRKWMSSKLITHSNQGKAMMNKRAMACNSNSKRDRDRNRYNQYNNNFQQLNH